MCNFLEDQINLERSTESKAHVQAMNTISPSEGTCLSMLEA